MFQSFAGLNSTKGLHIISITDAIIKVLKRYGCAIKIATNLPFPPRKVSLVSNLCLLSGVEASTGDSRLDGMDLSL